LSKIKISVEWDFEGTEFENLMYREAMSISGLKSTYKIEYDEEETDVESYLIEIAGGILPLSWEIVD
jgi:hypothetical protein